MIRVHEFTYLYRLKEFKEYEYYELVPWVREARIIPRLLRRWGVSSLGASFLYQFFVLHYFAHILSSLTLLFVVLCAVKKWLKLKSRYRQCVYAAIKYVRMIDNFNELVDPRTLALHCLSLEPFAYVLSTIEIKEKKSKCKLVVATLPFFFNKFFSFTEMTTKFN